MFLAHVAIVESGFGRATAAWAHVYSSNGCINVWPTKRVCEFGPASNVISIHKCQNYDTHTHTYNRTCEGDGAKPSKYERKFHFRFVFAASSGEGRTQPKTKSSAAAVKQHTRPQLYKRLSACVRMRHQPTTIKILIDCNVFNKMKYVLAGSPFILLFDFSASTCRAFYFRLATVDGTIACIALTPFRH